MKLTVEETAHQAHARTLLADMAGAPTSHLPRRATLVDWLNDYLSRASENGYVTNLAEADDLIALDRFLRAHEVPACSSAA